MRRTEVIPLAALGLLTALLAAGPALPATYHGKSVDGRRYVASILNNDWGRFDNVEVKFHEDRAYAYLPSGGRLVLVLQDEEITDPHCIPAQDPRRGMWWEIDVKDMSLR